MKKIFSEAIRIEMEYNIMLWILVLIYISISLSVLFNPMFRNDNQTESEINGKINETMDDSTINLNDLICKSNTYYKNKLAEINLTSKETLFVHNIDSVNEFGEITIIYKSDDGINSNILYRTPEDLLDNVSKLNTVDQYVFKGTIINYDRNLNSYNIDLTGVWTLNDYLQ